LDEEPDDKDQEEDQESDNDGKDDEAQSGDQDKVSIMMTTHIGSKGLSAGFVFVVGLNEGNFQK